MRKVIIICGMVTAALGLSASAALAHRYQVADPCSYTRFCDDGNFPCHVNILYPPGAHSLNYDSSGWLLNAQGHREMRCVNVVVRKSDKPVRNHDHHDHHNHHNHHNKH
jgi:hypothetical protein